MATADLYVTKTASPNPVGIGQPLIYTITASNNGPDTITTAELTDDLPSGVYLSDITVTQGSYCYENGTITWSIGTLEPGPSGSAAMTVTVIPSAEGTIDNSALIYSTNEDDVDPNPNNNQVIPPVSVTVSPAVDLIIIKNSCPTSTTAGNPISYSIVVLNNGPSSANNVTVTDTLPAEIDPASITVDTSGTYSISGNIVTIKLGTLDANNKASIGITVTPTSEGVLNNTAKVTSNEPDVNPENNTASVSTLVVPAADIEITKTASSQEVVIGDTLIYTLLVKNNGPSAATNVTVIDTLPPDLPAPTISPSQGSYSQSGDVITFILGDLARNSTATITIAINPGTEGMIINSAAAAAAEEDPNKCNNSDSVCAYVKRVVSTDISVEKSHSPEPAGICTPVTYTLTVTNHGPVSATGITLVDQIPSSMEIISVTSSQGRCCICSNKGCHEPCRKDESYCSSDEGCGKCSEHKEICSRINEIICQLGSLAVGDSAKVQIKAKPKMYGEITNTAIVTANEADPNTTDNEAENTLHVITPCEQMQLLIDKVNDLISSHAISEQHGNALLSILNSAKPLVCCDNIIQSRDKLNVFINKVNLYIQKGYISSEQGCCLIKAADTIIEELTCHNNCDCHDSGYEEDKD